MQLDNHVSIVARTLYPILLAICQRRLTRYRAGRIFSERCFPASKVSDGGGGKTPCGELNPTRAVHKLAMKFAISEINKRNDILPGIVLATIFKETCCDQDYAVNETLNFDFVKDAFRKEPMNAGHVTCSVVVMRRRLTNQWRRLLLPQIVIFINNPELTDVISRKVPVISFTATSPSLSNMDYFLRTVPPDSVVVEVMVDLIQKLRWNIVMVLYVDNEFGHYAAEGFRRAIRLTMPKICIVHDDKFKPNSDKAEIMRVVKDITNVTKSRIIVFFGTKEDFAFFHKRSGSFNANDYVWISSELWYSSELTSILHKVENILAIVPKQSFLSDHFLEYCARHMHVNITSACLKENVERSVHVIPLILNAVFAAAAGIHHSLGCERVTSCRNRLGNTSLSSLLRNLKNLNETNHLTNQIISFDENRNPPEFRFPFSSSITPSLYNEAKQTMTSLATGSVLGLRVRDLSGNVSSFINYHAFDSTCGINCHKGSYKLVKEDYPDCCWTCKKCTGNMYTNSSDQLSCLKCAEDRWPNDNHSSCDPIKHEYLSVFFTPGVLLLVWNILGIIGIVIISGVFVKHSSSHIVKASSRTLSLLLLLGIFMEFVIVLTSLREPQKAWCTTMFVLTHATRCLVAGTLLMKTNRIHRIFRKTAMIEPPRCLGNNCQLLIIVIIVFISIIISTTALFVNPELGNELILYVKKEKKKTAFLLCNFIGRTFQNTKLHILLWSYEYGLSFICTYQAYLVRKVPENYNEAWYITITMVTISTNILIYFISVIGAQDKNKAYVYFTVKSLTATVALGCMFIPKVYIIIFKPEKNVPHNVASIQLGTFVDSKSSVVKSTERTSNVPHKPPYNWVHLWILSPVL
ncbi:LOW QUALITY PROTEIN: extracellular calcium-sensing receptor-like [Xenia sp. Carnegie-2017]|uniref:LOW QUALITY PROTEIN: extracellular calcium-sensing receptor-like n=1 Tax=Xenia sp. Carnegie-2017 TaxID=2897299 RepID=UPI001F0488AD|nr:LOW QUALITY PROTEIN: extracellular calcium-sensing receptor-like [Xenia sp. Carnegie-2017]